MPAPRKYRIDTDKHDGHGGLELSRGIRPFTSPICSSVYEDAPLNYLIDYAMVGFPVAEPPYAAVARAWTRPARRSFTTNMSPICVTTAFNSIPLHLESTAFPTVTPRALNISTRGLIGNAGSLADRRLYRYRHCRQDGSATSLGAIVEWHGPFGRLSPIRFLLSFDSTGTAIASNDDWQTDPGAAQITADGLAPSDPPKPPLSRP